MLTPKLTGIFDCRKFDQSGKKPHEQREWLGENENVTLSVLLPANQVPDCFMINGALDEFARPRSSRREVEDAKAAGREPVSDVVSVRFKVGANCKWFDRYAKATERPTNIELEASRYQVQIDFSRKEKNPANPLAPSGYWANAIMFKPIEQNPFGGQAFDEGTDERDEREYQPEQPKDAPIDDLPFE